MVDSSSKDMKSQGTRQVKTMVLKNWYLVPVHRPNHTGLYIKPRWNINLTNLVK